jgi:hypothetical protein
MELSRASPIDMTDPLDIEFTTPATAPALDFNIVPNMTEEQLCADIRMFAGAGIDGRRGSRRTGCRR